jgi:hypothetical protein
MTFIEGECSYRRTEHVEQEQMQRWWMLVLDNPPASAAPGDPINLLIFCTAASFTTLLIFAAT